MLKKELQRMRLQNIAGIFVLKSTCTGPTLLPMQLPKPQRLERTIVDNNLCVSLPNQCSAALSSVKLGWSEGEHVTSVCDLFHFNNRNLGRHLLSRELFLLSFFFCD